MTRKPRAPGGTSAPIGAGLPGFLTPMKALGVTAIPETPGWHLEIKYDGYRALAAVDGPAVELWSRNELSLSDDYPEIVAALRRRRFRATLLDGEIVALDAEGRSRFQLLQARETGEARPPIFYYVFDVLSHRGRSVANEPIEKRRALLAKLLPAKDGVVRLSPEFSGSPQRLLTDVRKHGLEGIVAKAAGSSYEPGRRSGAWLKCRVVNEQEFIIGGFTPPQGSRSHFGALLLGYRDGRKLRYAGKVGTGFDDQRLAELAGLFRSRLRAKNPFDDAVPERRVRWVRPDVVCQVRFVEWTSDGRLRQPVFLGLRRDKPAAQVVREAPATATR
ncbi:MAG TPA: non-homologous end-joining DNA ligase [Candidatus Didemnitutus sp.]|nr:non-homologous end-joining DNA ligase [Candidatus Didemnitutus sp.]